MNERTDLQPIPSPNSASVEISETAKGEPRVTVKLVRADGLHEIADEVMEVYRILKVGLERHG